ncbi:ATP synthase F1 subunit gamma [Candidatus Gracilibacteria bacterium 28_42_T64]|nr:ATP synthase F1 subunit gamma [Candidatus Gracilibacteria bacterium 28_42_T64]
MANAKEIKRKIGSIKNTGKITKAMELISTVKMKKAGELALQKRDFVFEMLKIFLRVEEHLGDFPLFKEGKGDKTLAVVITSNKGLCGGYNINVMKKVSSYIKETGEELEFISVGKKASNFVARTGNKLIADFSVDFSDNIDPIFTKEISQLLREEFQSGKYNKVVVFYNHYINTIKQVPVAKLSLPIDAKDIKAYLTSILGDEYDIEKELGELNIYSYDLEPTPEKLANEMIPMILDLIFFDILLEAKASEHSSRMIAMKNAKDSAKKIADKLTLQYNKARQAIITREVSEITAGVESMKDV